MRTRCLVAILFVFIILPISSYAQNTTRKDAANAIQQVEQDINEMAEAGFPVSYVKDILTSASQALERADFAELLRQNATGELAEQAKKALEGLNYKGFMYDEVLKYTQEISSRKQQAYNLSDSIRALEIKIDEYKKSIDTSEAESILADAKIAFEKERYGETEDLLSKANSELEEKKAELTTVNIIVRSGKSFVEKNWLEILIVSVVIAISGWFGWRNYRVKKIRDKLKKLKIEQESLHKLMKKTQIERFKKGNISESIYKIRMEKYTERLNEVKQTIPVFEAMLKGKRKVL